MQIIGQMTSFVKSQIFERPCEAASKQVARRSPANLWFLCFFLKSSVIQIKARIRWRCKSHTETPLIRSEQSLICMDFERYIDEF